MNSLRRAVLLLLLLTMPLQAAVGAAGYVCSHAARHSDGAVLERDAEAGIVVHGGSASHADPGTCEFCSACSFSLAPARDSTSRAPGHAPSLRVWFYVDPAALTHVGDTLFHPPRSILT